MLRFTGLHVATCVVLGFHLWRWWVSRTLSAYRILCHAMLIFSSIWPMLSLHLYLLRGIGHTGNAQSFLTNLKVVLPRHSGIFLWTELRNKRSAHSLLEQQLNMMSPKPDSQIVANVCHSSTTERLFLSVVLDTRPPLQLWKIRGGRDVQRSGQVNGGIPAFNVAQSLSNIINCILSASFYGFCPTISNHTKVCIIFFTSFTPYILCALMLFLFEERITFSDLSILPL